MIAVQGLVKRFGSKFAVANLSFEVQEGRVTGFLGPNGSGKSTTMRCMLGLDRADAGQSFFGGRPYHELERPLHQVGALLDAGYVHPGRSGRNHLRWLAASNGLPTSRVDEALATVGLTDVGTKRVKTYSLGMKQRLGLAGVLLGDPHTIILDEPANGLDPEGIREIREIIKALGREGKTVFLSSHLLDEVEQTCTHVAVIKNGKLVKQGSVQELTSRNIARLEADDTDMLRTAVRSYDGALSADVRDGAVFVALKGGNLSDLNRHLAGQGVYVSHLSEARQSLEEVFIELTS